AASSLNIPRRWQQGKFVGGGTFGNVYQAVNLDSAEIMAVKEIRISDPKLMTPAMKSIKEEMTVLEMLDHPNVVNYYGIEVHRDKVYIFMEFCEGGSLANLLEHGRIADETVIQVYAWEMLQGLAYLHSKGVVHRDVKPESILSYLLNLILDILLDGVGNIKFSDFGAAKVFAKQGKTKAGVTMARTNLNSMTGTPMYMSPEGTEIWLSF